MDNGSDTAKVVGLLLGLAVVFLLNYWLFPDDLAKTVLQVLAAP